VSSERPTSGGLSRAFILLLTALAILVADQLTKALVVGNLAIGERVDLLGDLVQVWHVQNRGAAFSLFQGWSLSSWSSHCSSISMVAYFHCTRARPQPLAPLRTRHRLGGPSTASAPPEL
jgi:lipoprotein signal peptidase